MVSIDYGMTQISSRCDLQVHSRQEMLKERIYDDKPTGHGKDIPSIDISSPYPYSRRSYPKLRAAR